MNVNYQNMEIPQLYGAGYVAIKNKIIYLWNILYYQTG